MISVQYLCTHWVIIIIIQFLNIIFTNAVFSVRPGSHQISGESPGVFLHFPLDEKPLLSAPAGASKRETPTWNLTESTANDNLT